MSKRSIESRLDDLEQETGDDTGGVTIAYRNPVTDELTTPDGEPIDRNEHTGVLIELTRSLVMERERAEREGRTILGPAEDAAEGVDAVEVPIDQ